VTDATNVTAAGALMDSEVTNLAQVKAFSAADYATAAQGTLATNALPKTGGALTGAVTTTSTFDGRDVSVDGTKLDGIEALADVTDATNVTAAGALMDSELAGIAAVKALNQGVATTDSPTFAGIDVTGTVTADGLTVDGDLSV
jgi:trimeric autotransporter adhesin